jgi:hypothetical protein
LHDCGVVGQVTNNDLITTITQMTRLFRIFFQNDERALRALELVQQGLDSHPIAVEKNFPRHIR